MVDRAYTLPPPMTKSLTRPTAPTGWFAAFALANALVVATAEEAIDFNRDIRPILSGKCFACHGPDEEERGADLRLDTQDGSRHDMGGYSAVVPGDPDSSILYQRVKPLSEGGTTDCGNKMPQGSEGLSAEQAELVRAWIAGGAKE